MKMQSIEIKELVPEDNLDAKMALLPAFLNIWNAAENLKYLSTTLIPVEQELVQTWLENHKHQGGKYFCAQDAQGKILGIMVIKVTPSEGFEIYGLGVLPQYKNNGIGRKLTQHAINIAESHGYKSLTVLVFADNTPMLCLLLKLGFIPVSMDYNKRSDGADSVYLRKYISKVH